MQQLTAQAFDLAEKQLMDGTISPSTLNVLLKAGTIENELALENLRANNKLVKSKVDMIESDMDSKSNSAQALEAFRGYMGSVPSEDPSDV